MLKAYACLLKRKILGAFYISPNYQKGLVILSPCVLLHASEKMQFKNMWLVILSSGCFKDVSGCAPEVLSLWLPITVRLLFTNELLYQTSRVLTAK